MNPTLKKVLVASAGLAGGAVTGGTVVGYLAYTSAPRDGWEGLVAVIFGILGALVCAPIGCYVALRIARIPQAFVTTVIATVLAAAGLTLLGGIGEALSSLTGSASLVVLGVAATIVPAWIVGRRNGWFTRSLS